MVIGNGDIASVLNDRSDVVFFASGVSNSGCDCIVEFQREVKMLKEIYSFRHLVYFSSLSIYYSNSAYTRHKKHMEKIIENTFLSYTVVRLGNITWGKNPNTFINYLKSHPEAEVKPVWRHVIDKDEFLYWMDKIRVGEKDIMNIPGRRVWVPDYVKEIR